MSVITVTAYDEAGVEQVLSDAMVYFEIEGPSVIAGVDAGDIECHTTMKGKEKRLYRGSVRAYVQATGEVSTTIEAKGSEYQLSKL